MSTEKDKLTLIISTGDLRVSLHRSTIKSVVKVSNIDNQLIACEFDKHTGAFIQSVSMIDLD